MKKLFLPPILVLIAMSFSAQSSSAQLSTAPVAPEELEAKYTVAIENRTSAILGELDLKDARKEAKVRDTIVAFYRALRARDAVIDNYFAAIGEDADYSNPSRSPYSQKLTAPIRELFLGSLDKYLTPEQVESVKDQLTYQKVRVTYNAYQEVLPSLKEDEKARVLELLKKAREEAITGGSSQEKTAIFENYKKQIDAFLGTKGYDVAKAIKDWESQQARNSNASVAN